MKVSNRIMPPSEVPALGPRTGAEHGAAGDHVRLDACGRVGVVQREGRSLGILCGLNQLSFVLLMSFLCLLFGMFRLDAFRRHSGDERLGPGPVLLGATQRGPTPSNHM